jgi:hypothetical protein
LQEHERRVRRFKPGLHAMQVHAAEVGTRPTAERGEHVVQAVICMISFSRAGRYSGYEVGNG